MNEIVLSQDINVITAEINSYKNVAGQAIFEIGRRLKEVKEKDLVHGEWENWCKNTIDMTPQYANKYIKIYDEFKSSNRIPSFDLGVKALYEIATLPEEERRKSHQIPSSGEMKAVDEMTMKELREVKKDLKEKEEAIKQLKVELSQEKNKPIKVETQIIETEVDRTDYQQINKLQNDLNVLQNKLTNVKREKETLEEWAELYEKDAKDYQKMKEEIDHLYSQKDDLHRQIASATSISALVVDIEDMLKDKLAPVKYSRAIQEQGNNEIVVNNLREIIEMVKGWTKEMEGLLPNKNYIDMEVIG